MWSREGATEPPALQTALLFAQVAYSANQQTTAVYKYMCPAGVDYRQCIEKEDLVQLVVRTYRSVTPF